MPTAEVNGTSIFYRQRGRGPDLVLIHGLGANHAFWFVRVVPRLTKDYRVTVYDLRGHGVSAMPARGYTPKEMAADLVELLERVGIERAHLVGHSFGGAIALNVAGARPDLVDTVTVVDSRLLALQPQQRVRDWPAWTDWKKRLGPAANAIPENAEIDHRLLGRLARIELGSKRGGFIPFTAWGRGARSREQWLQLLGRTRAATDFDKGDGVTVARLRRLDTPLLAIYGGRSYTLPTVRELNRLLPSTSVVIVPRVGHYVPVAAPETFVDSLKTFLVRSAA